MASPASRSGRRHTRNRVGMALVEFGSPPCAGSPISLARSASLRIVLGSVLVLLLSGLLTSAAGSERHTLIEADRRSVSAARDAAEEGRFREAVLLAVRAIEETPSGRSSPDGQRRFLEEFVIGDFRRWFDELSQDDKEVFIESIETGQEPPRSKAPMAKVMTRWLRSVRPSHAHFTPPMKLLLGLAHWKAGHRDKAIAYATQLLESDTDSVSAEYAAMGLVLTYVYESDWRETTKKVERIVRLMPNRPAGPWAVAQLNWRLCRFREIDLAKTFNQRVVAKHPHTRAARVAETMMRLIQDARMGDCDRLLDTLGQVQPYMRLAEVDVVLDVLLMGIDWRRKREPYVRSTIDRARRDLRHIAENDHDPFRRKYARLLLADICVRTGRLKDALAILDPFALPDGDDEDPEVRAYALAMIGLILWQRDPPVAVEALEAFADDYLDLAWSDAAVLMLAGLYLRSGMYEEALVWFGWLKDRLDSGTAIEPADEQMVRAGLAGALLRTGRIGEAWRAIAPLVEKMTPDQIAAGLRRARIWGYREEAKAVRKKLAADGLYADQ